MARFFSILGILFLLLVGLKIHGYSISAWRPLLNLPPGNEVLVGKARPIRGDDWGHDLPMIFSQIATSPRFPRINPLYGDGQDMLAPHRVPVRSWVWFFRPSTWGYLLGADFGMAWAWQWLVFGLFVTSFLLAFWITRGNWFAATASGIAFTFSPFFQFWGLHKAEIAIHALCVVLGVVWIFQARSRQGKVAAYLFTAYSLVAFVLHHMYPPFQVSVGYWILLASFILVAPRLREKGSAESLLFVCAAITVAGMLGVAFFIDGMRILWLVTQTSYPGQRLSVGGVLPLNYLLVNPFYGAAVVRQWVGFGNLCESSSFFYFAPLVLTAIIVKPPARRWPFFLLAGFGAVLIVYGLFGLPAWLQSLLLFHKVPVNRLALAMGLADWLMLLLFLALPAAARALSKKQTVIVLSVWGWLCVLAAVWLGTHSTEFPAWFLVAGIAMNLALGAALVTPKLQKVFLVGWAAVSVGYAGFFNPVVRGGFSLFDESPLVQAMREEGQLSKTPPRWVTLAWESDDLSLFRARMLANLPHIIGQNSLDGAIGQPQIDIWKRLDPQERAKPIWNQLSYPIFVRGEGMEVRFGSLVPAQFTVELDPTEAYLEKLGVTHMVVPGAAPAEIQGWERRYAGPEATVYRRKNQFRDK